MPHDGESRSRWGAYPIRADVLKRTLQRAKELGLTNWIERLADALSRDDDGAAAIVPSQGAHAPQRPADPDGSHGGDAEREPQPKA